MATRRSTNYWDDHNADDAIEERWPYDGPHSPETIINAAQGLERLVRYMDNASQYPSLFDQPWQVHDMLLAVHGALYGLDQLLDQAAVALEHLGTSASTRGPIAALKEARGWLGVPPEPFDDKGKFAQPTQLVAAVNTAVLAINRVQTKREVQA